jgi:hypothetical protein
MTTPDNGRPRETAPLEKRGGWHTPVSPQIASQVPFPGLPPIAEPAPAPQQSVSHEPAAVSKD